MVKYDYEGEKKKLYAGNLKAVQKATGAKWLRLKIKNFAEKFGFKEKEIAKRIEKDKFLAATFAKDPGRQNFYQKQALKFLRTMDVVKEAKELSAGGKNAWFVVNGEVGKKGKFKKEELAAVKSIDFKITLVDGTVILASHKYTKDKGGAQDNQKNDLLNFIRQAKAYKGKYVMMAIADGAYYREAVIWGQLEHAARDSDVKVCNMENFEEVALGIIEAKKNA